MVQGSRSMMSEGDRLIGVPLLRSRTLGLPFVVGFFFAFRVFIMILTVAFFGTDPQVGVEVNLTLNFFLLVLALFFCLGGAHASLKQMLRPAPIHWAIAFLAFSFASLWWSATASLPAAFVYWCAMAADFVIVVLLLRAGALAAASSSLIEGYVWGACTVAVIAWMLPPQPDLRLGYEELLGPNQIGYACAFGFFLAQYLMRVEHGRWGVAATLLAITLLRSLSKTTIIAFLVGEAWFMLRDRSISRKKKLLLLCGSCVVLGIFSSLLSSYYDDYTNTGSQSENLTGRLEIWAYMVAEAVEHPWIGHGFHSVWKVVPPFGPDQFEARHAHNEFLQQFYAYGAVGVCLVIGTYLSFYRQIRGSVNARVKTCLSSLLLFVLVRGLADTEPFDLSLPLWAIFLLSTLLDQGRIDDNAVTRT